MKRISIFICVIFLSIFLNSEVIFFDGFEENSDWNLTGEFQIGIPNGLGGEHGNSDPIEAFEGSNVLGVDLIGLGNYPGDYETNLSNDEYKAISPTIDCSEYINVSLNFKRWLGIEQPAYDHAKIKISTDNGTSWTNIWENNQTISDNNWQDITIDISNYANLNPYIKIAFTIGETDGSWQYCGWNIDNFTISGDHVQYGDIQGNIYDNITLLPINNAMVSTNYAHTFSDSCGFYYLHHIPCIPLTISISANGYQSFVSNSIIPQPDTVITQNFYLQQEENIPPSPYNLTATVLYNNVTLNWHSPQNSDYFFITYNIFRNNVLIQSTPDTIYNDTNLVLGTYLYYVTAVYDVGSSLPSNEVQVQITSTATNEDEISQHSSMTYNYPNPFCTTSEIFYEIKQPGKITINIYNIKGQKVKTLLNEYKSPGSFRAIWDGTDDNNKLCSSGIYLYIISVNGKKVKNGKMIFRK